MLVHQIQRLASVWVIVSCHEAQNFPFIKVPATPEELKANLEGHTKDGKITFQFDRILSDVPCSGDGAMRKIPDMWQKWTPALGLGMRGEINCLNRTENHLPRNEYVILLICL